MALDEQEVHLTVEDWLERLAASSDEKVKRLRERLQQCPTCSERCPGIENCLELALPPVPPD